MMNKNEIKFEINRIINEFHQNEEFDAGMIWQMLIADNYKTIAFSSVRNILQHMNLQRRRLTKDETECWRRLNKTQPKIVYRKHGGKDPNNYERGVKAKRRKRPTVAQLELQQQNDEECAVCPEWDTCQGNINPCPRYPDKATAPKDRVMKLEDF